MSFFPNDDEAQRRVLILLWLIIALFGFCFTIACFVAATEASSSYGFPAVWTGLLTCSFIVGSYLVMKKYQRPLAYGFLLGTSTMLTNMMLMNAALWGGAHDKDDFENTANAVTAFSALLFIFLVPYTALLIMWRSAILHEDDFERDAHGISSSTPIMQHSGMPVGGPSMGGNVPSAPPPGSSAADSYQGINAAL